MGHLHDLSRHTVYSLSDSLQDSLTAGQQLVLSNVFHVMQKRGNERNNLREAGREKKGWDLTAHRHLEHGQAGLTKVVKSTPRLFIGKSASKNLHAQEGKNKNEENEEHEKGVDGGDGVN